MKKRFLASATAFALILSLLPVASLGAETPPAENSSVATTVEDAILYPSEESGSLDYNVVYTDEYDSEVKILDSSNSGFDIDTVEELETVMGVADAPKVQLGTSTGLRTLGYAVTANLGFDEDGDIAQIEITDVNERPIVGISWKKDNIGSDYQGFAEAFERNGAYAVYLPQVHDADEAREVLSQIDGIFMTGGEDWNPDLYDQEQTPHGSRGWNDARDTSDINLMQQAIEMDVPLLAVCRGEQGFNVAMGGGLIQDVPYYLGQKVLSGEITADRVTGILSGSVPSDLTGYEAMDDALKVPVEDTGYQKWNSETKEFEAYKCGEDAHLRVYIDGLIHSGGTGYHELAGGAGNEEIAINKESKWLYDILGTDTLEWVATAHHQAVDPDNLGDDLTIVAMSSDGIVEAIEHQDSLFALALQWHPERDALEDTRGTDVDQNQCNALLGALVEYAGIYDDQTKTELTFTYPDGIVQNEVTVELYSGFPTSASSTLDTMISRGYLQEILPNEDGSYTINKAGTYSYHISGDGYYNILKIFNVTDEDIAAGKMTVEVTGGKLGTNEDAFGDGYQPTVKPSHAPDSYVMDSRDNMLCIWPDEILDQHFSVEGTTHEAGSYTTPAFDGTDAAHEFTTQDEMVAYMEEMDAQSDDMYLYSAGTTPNYKFDIPLAIFTETAIPEDATLEEAADLVNANGKTTVWYQSQIHPNEPAAGEGALVVVTDLVTDPETAALLDDINIVVVPRINPDGSYLFSRATYDGFDMNRDHMSLKAAELAQLHTAYRLFMAEVVVDTHEFTFYGAKTAGYMNDSNDIETTPATSLNNNAAVTDFALDMCGYTFEQLEDAGLRVYHYGQTANNPIGRAYFGLYDCLSFLVETRGIGAGKTNFERRVFSQETAVLSYLTYAAEHSEEIKELVADAREETIAKGATYDEDDVLVLYQTASGETQTDYEGTLIQYNMDGTVHSSETDTMALYDTIERSRIRPTAYVIPADLENIDKILYILDNQGAEYYRLSDGSRATLEQYYYVGPYLYNDKERGIEAGLRDAERVRFSNGAYVIPMDQVAGNVIAMLMEPDVTDSNGYDGSLYQYGVIDYDEETLNFPIYRYTGDNPRETLVSNSSSGGGSSGGGSSSGNNGSQTEEPDEPSGTQDETVFSDVSSSAWYAEAVNYVYENGLMTGISSTQFAPNNTLTRAMVVQTLYAMANKPAVSGSENFTDVSSGDWFADAVTWASANGIVSGYNATQFAPNDPLTREQLALILYGYAQMRGYNTTQSGTSIQEFTDYGSISAWALEAMDWAVNAGLLSGKGNGVLDPTGTATRAEVAQILMNFSETVVG